MKINVYKGFSELVLGKLTETPIIDVPFSERMHRSQNKRTRVN